MPDRGHQLNGKPPRGWKRIREWFQGGREGRTETVRHAFPKILQNEKPDLVWCHNLAGGEKWGWGEFLVSLATAHAPVVWTLHDMWALGNGGQAYWEAGSVVESGRCKVEEDKHRQAGRAQGAAVEGLTGSRVVSVCSEKGKHRVTLTAPSEWLAGLAGKISGYPCRNLPNPIDLDVYRPGSREQARKRLGLPQEAFLVLAGADSLEDRRKGLDLLRSAWSSLPAQDGLLILFGRHGISGPGTRYLGPIDSDAMMIHAYQAADLYVHPARMENASCQIQEAMACGTPTLAFATGGNAELIQAGQSGLLAARVDAESLAAELERAWELGPRLEKMGGEARQRALAIWNPDRLIRMWEETLRPGLSGPR